MKRAKLAQSGSLSVRALKCAMAYTIGCNIFEQKKKGTICATFLSTLAM
jgi:hypothetical protein